jgi:hypothetical protein
LIFAVVIDQALGARLADILDANLARRTVEVLVTPRAEAILTADQLVAVIVGPTLLAEAIDAAKTITVPRVLALDQATLAADLDKAAGAIDGDLARRARIAIATVNHAAVALSDGISVAGAIARRLAHDWRRHIHGRRHIDIRTIVGHRPHIPIDHRHIDASIGFRNH